MEYVIYIVFLMAYIIMMLLTARYMYRNNFGGGVWAIFLVGGGSWPIMIPLILIAHFLDWAINFITKEKE